MLGSARRGSRFLVSGLGSGGMMPRLVDGWCVLLEADDGVAAVLGEGDGGAERDHDEGV